MDAKELITRRVAREIRPGMLVNLGIGLPSMVASFVPADLGVFFQAENGVIGLVARPPEGLEAGTMCNGEAGAGTAPAPARSQYFDGT